MDLSTIIPGIALVAGVGSATAVGSRLLFLLYVRRFLSYDQNRPAVPGRRLEVKAPRVDERLPQSRSSSNADESPSAKISRQSPANALEGSSLLGARQVNGHLPSELVIESCGDSARHIKLVQVKRRGWEPLGSDAMDPLRPIDGDMSELHDTVGVEIIKEPTQEV